MLVINHQALREIAEKNGWLHDSGRLRGTINTTQMAKSLSVSVTTVIRAYDDGATGLKLLEKLSDISGKSLDELVVKVAA
jgi:hypothetical protein